MKIKNVLCLTAVTVLLCSAGIGNGAYQQRDGLQQHVDDPILLQQQDKDQLHIFAAQLTTTEKKPQYGQQYCQRQTEPAGETFRHRHQLKKGQDETGGKQKQAGPGGKNQGGSGGKKQGGPGGGNKGGTRN